MLHLQVRKKVPVPRCLRTLCLEPPPKPSTDARLTEGLLAGKSTRFERFLEPSQVGHAAPEIRVALGHLPREGDRKPQTVLEVPQLCAIGKLPCVKGKGNEIGFGAMTEIKLYTSKGLQFVGPLPAEVQNYTTYEAALMTAAPAADAAKAVLRQLATPAGKAAFVSAGVE